MIAPPHVELDPRRALCYSPRVNEEIIMRYWLNLAAFHVERRDATSALAALRHALSRANSEDPAARGSIMRAMNYCRAIARSEAR